MRTVASWALAVATLSLSHVAHAQSQGCAETTRFDPPLRILRCSDGLVIETERDAALRTIDRDGDGRLEGAELGGRGALITLPAGRRSRQSGFQILTPHAIASVRGTVYAVDVTYQSTSVFVEQGRVGVSRRADPSVAVVLGPGEGVDVDGGTGPLEVKRWPRERVSGLLSRFGR